MSAACTASRSPASDNSCSAEARRVILTNVLVIHGVIQGTYYWCYLLPAFEEDPLLGWTKQDSTLAATSTIIAENVGILLMGPAADHLPVAHIFVLNGAAACLCLALEVASPSSLVLLVLMNIAVFVKSIIWPAVCAHVGGRLPESLHDFSSFTSALSSRSGELGSGLILGFLMKQFDFSWRGASLSLLGWAGLVLGLAYFMYPRTCSSNSSSASRKNDVSGRQLLDIFQSLASNMDFWLILVTQAGSGLYWALQTYTPVLLQDLHGFSSGDAASNTAVLPAGMVTGLCVGCASTYIFSLGAGRVLHILQATCSVIGLGILATWPNLPMQWTLVFMFMVGFGAVVPLYIPSLNFAANGLPDERALRLSFLWALTGFSQVAVTFGFGKMREYGEDSSAVASNVFTIVGFGLLVSILSMQSYYWRLSSNERAPLLPKASADAHKNSYAAA